MSVVSPINRLGNRLATSSGRLSLAGMVLVAATLAAACLALWDRREDVFASYRREISNLGITLTEQAERSLQAVDLVLGEAQREILGMGIRDPGQLGRAMASVEVYNFLLRHSKNLTQVQTIDVVDASGTLVSSARGWPAPQLNLADRDWFTYLRDHPEADHTVSRPMAGPSGEWTFYLARRLGGPHGEFLGAVVAGVEARYFEETYRTISLQQDGSIALFTRDGEMIARYPHVETAIGKKLPPESGWYERVAQGGGTYRSPGYIDGLGRIVSVHPLHDYPLVVAVTIGEEAALTEWRRQSGFVAAGALCLALGLALLFGTLVVRSWRLEKHSAELDASTAALTRSEARFRDFAETSSDWFWETDEQHRFTYVSEGIRAFGQDPASQIGHSRIDIAASSDRDQDKKWAEHIRVLHRCEPFRDFIFSAKFGDHSEHTVSISGKPFFGEAGRFLGYRGIGRDITAEHLAQTRLQEAKAAAEAANLAKSQFLANVSHELRTPLNAIIGFAEVLELGMTGPLLPKQAENIRIIRESGEHLHRVINDILDLAKIDAGKLELIEEAGVDPRGIVEACVALVKARANEAGLTLSVDIMPDLPPIVADMLRLKQILLNLLSNAIKFTEPGGAITIAVFRAGNGGMFFEVRDTGVGMTAEEIQTALEPFGQVDAGLGRRHEGTGLGLPIASRLAELHGGSLHIYSNKGGGTSVVVMIPPGKVIETEPSPAATEAAA